MATLTRDEWRAAFDARLKSKAFINIMEAGIDETDIDRWYASGDTPQEVVDWYITKYDLDTEQDWSF